MNHIHSEEDVGFMSWKNLPYDPALSAARFHVDCAYRSQLGVEWKRMEIRNPYNRLYFIEHGEAVLTLEQKQITLKPGRVYLIPAQTLHSHYCQSAVIIHWCHFQATTESNIDLFEVVDCPLSVSSRNIDGLKSLFKELESLMEKEGGEYYLLRVSLLLRMLAPFIKASDPRKTQLQFDAQKRFLPVLSYIDEHLDQRLSLQELAQCIDISEEHFCRIFRECFQTPPAQYVLKKRVRLAQEMLCHGTESVQEIGKRCGFSDPYYFSKAFKRITGTSPSQYRNQLF